MVLMVIQNGGKNQSAIIQEKSKHQVNFHELYQTVQHSSTTKSTPSNIELYFTERAHHEFGSRFKNMVSHYRGHLIKLLSGLCVAF